MASKKLRNLGILEKAQQCGAMDLANHIEHTLKAPFQVAVQTQQSVGQWIVPMVSMPGEQASRNDESEQGRYVIHIFLDRDSK